MRVVSCTVRQRFILAVVAGKTVKRFLTHQQDFHEMMVVSRKPNAEQFRWMLPEEAWLLQGLPLKCWLPQSMYSTLHLNYPLFKVIGLAGRAFHMPCAAHVLFAALTVRMKDQWWKVSQ